jgi:Peptidase inhibitor I78 family
MFIILCLSGCVPVSDAPVLGPDTCGASVWQARLGEPVAAFALPAPGARVIRPGDAITEDYSEMRLNIDVDARGRILRAWCG